MNTKSSILLTFSLLLFLASFVSCDKENMDVIDSEFDPDTLICNLDFDLTLGLGGIPLETVSVTNITGGEEPYTYAWSTGDTTVLIVAEIAGTYTVTVTDANNCTQENSEEVTLNDPCDSTFNVIFSQFDSIALVQLTALPEGGQAPYSYLWSTGETTDNIAVTVTGTYTVTVTDANACFVEVSINVVVNNPCLDFMTTIYFNPDSLGGLDYLNAITTGGTTPYSFLWSTGETEQAIAIDSLGDFSVTVTDANGCEAEDDFM